MSAAGNRRDTGERTRIVIVDDHPVLRQGLARLIESKEGFTVCGEASKADEAIVLIRNLKPGLVIADIGLPGASGIELTKNIRAEFPKLPVLILSMHEESLYASRALRAGALGYIVKQDAVENIASALREVLAGRRYISPIITRDLIEIADGSGAGADSQNTIGGLSDRELEIFELIGKGHEVRDISKALGLSPKTVETHRTNIKEKLKLKNARQVARVAVQWVTEHSS
jgi:DNA-binding NarL/FixJ family response regulator